jgi:N-methylhydantoinase A
VWIDERGAIRIGPRSAGSYPGPACYGLGGNEPTVTDADLALGYLNPDYFLGGRMRLREEFAYKALETYIASKLGVDIHEAAYAIYEKVAEDIATAFRLHAAERGIDIRKFSLVVFGGAGPVHGISIARKLGVKRVIFPSRAGVLSACGLLVTPLQFSVARSYFMKLSRLNPAEYEKIFQQLIQQGVEALKKAKVSEDKITVTRKLDMRYEGQGFDIEVDDPYNGKFMDVDKLKESFEKRYHQIYALSGISENVEITAFKVTVCVPMPDLELFTPVSSISDGALKGYRECYFGDSFGCVRTNVYNRYKLTTGSIIDGPAIVEEEESTCVIPPGFRAGVDNLGNIVVEMIQHE